MENSQSWRTSWKTEREGNIWICVGASVAGQLLKEGRIDKLWLSVIPPQYWANGVRLFAEQGAGTAAEAGESAALQRDRGSGV